MCREFDSSRFHSCYGHNAVRAVSSHRVATGDETCAQREVAYVTDAQRRCSGAITLLVSRLILSCTGSIFQPVSSRRCGSRAVVWSPRRDEGTKPISCYEPVSLAVLLRVERGLLLVTLLLVAG